MGMDGVAIKARTDGEDVVVNFWDSEPRGPDPGAVRYWVFERECRNSAVLESITTSLRRARGEGKSIYIHPRPKTNEDARRNLKAFAAEYSERRCRPGFVPFATCTEVNSCLGWTEVAGADVLPFLSTCPVDRAPDDDGRYFAIVYSYVPAGKLDDHVMQSQLDFFYLTGFEIVPVNFGNWRGSGTLVDFSGLVFPYASEWEQIGYGRRVKDEKFGTFLMTRPNLPGQTCWPV